MKIRIGDRIQIRQNYGVDSGKKGIIIPWTAILTDGRGIPTNVPGEYHTLNKKDKYPVLFDDGSISLLTDGRLNLLPRENLR